MNHSTGEPIWTISLRNRAGVKEQRPRIADPLPLAITDDVLFRWARIIQIARLFPVMHAIRALEQKLRTGVCRSCGHKASERQPDRSVLAAARRQLGECPDEKARLVKEAAGILLYRVQYHDLAGTVHDVVR